MMVMTIMATATAIKFLYCYNFDCFYKGLSFLGDSPFFLQFPLYLPLGAQLAFGTKVARLCHIWVNFYSLFT